MNAGLMRVYKTFYNKKNPQKEFVENTNDLDELAEIIDNIRKNADKRDKIKIEIFSDEKLIGRIFVAKNEFSDDLTLRNKVGEVLKNKGMSKLELSNKIGLAYNNTCNLIDRGYLDQTALVNAIKIADVLEVRLEDLYEREETIDPIPPKKISFEKLKEMPEK